VRAVVALFVGWCLALLGLAAPPLHFLWSGGWIFSLLGGLIAYWLLMRTEASVLSAAEYNTITEDEGEVLARGA
jgi:NCS1 family nucleobase:cation symporter-1